MRVLLRTDDTVLKARSMMPCDIVQVLLYMVVEREGDSQYTGVACAVTGLG